MIGNWNRKIITKLAHMNLKFKRNLNLILELQTHNDNVHCTLSGSMKTNLCEDFKPRSTMNFEEMQR